MVFVVVLVPAAVIGVGFGAAIDMPDDIADDTADVNVPKPSAMASPTTPRICDLMEAERLDALDDLEALLTCDAALAVGPCTCDTDGPILHEGDVLRGGLALLAG